jgi:hypothetical protein
MIGKRSMPTSGKEPEPHRPGSTAQLSDAAFERGVDTVMEMAVRAVPLDESLTEPNALFCPVGPRPPDDCCIGCNDPVHVTGPLAPDVDTLADGTLAAESVTGLDVAHAANPINEAGKHRRLILIGILFEVMAMKPGESSNTVSLRKFRCQWNRLMETISLIRRIQT